MINFNRVFKIWLTAFVVTSGTWVTLLSGAKAQSAGTIMIHSSGIVQNGTILTDSTTNRRDTSDNPTNSGSNGGNITVTAGKIVLINPGALYVKRVPEPSFVGGILAVVVAAAVSSKERKRK